MRQKQCHFLLVIASRACAPEPGVHKSLVWRWWGLRKLPIDTREIGLAFQPNVGLLETSQKPLASHSISVIVHVFSKWKDSSVERHVTSHSGHWSPPPTSWCQAVPTAPRTSFTAPVTVAPCWCSSSRRYFGACPSHSWWANSPA